VHIQATCLECYDVVEHPAHPDKPVDQDSTISAPPAVLTQPPSRVTRRSRCLKPSLAVAALVASGLLLILPYQAAAQTGDLAKGLGAVHQRPFIVVLDPGHGGSDPGAVDASGRLMEKNLTLQVAQRAEIDLRAMGYQVYLTRTRDQGVNTPPRDLNHDGHVDHVDELDARNLFANRHHADLIVSIHFDGIGDPSIHGTHGYYCPARPFWRKSERLANLVTATITSSLTRAHYSSPNNGVQTDVADNVPQTRPDYPWFLILGPSLHHFVTGTNMPGALIESLFLSSPRDAAALGHSSIIAAIAQGYADGIRAYFGGKRVTGY
jgi:N-acetylmuramoyl-L-alanine amidase